MNREEALGAADALVTEWVGQVKNERGYVHDKWVPTPVEVRVEATLKVAAWLMAQDPVPVDRSAQVTTLFGWHEDGPSPTKTQYESARAFRLNPGGGPIPAVALDLAGKLMDAYEASPRRTLDLPPRPSR